MLYWPCLAPFFFLSSYGWCLSLFYEANNKHFRRVYRAYTGSEQYHLVLDEDGTTPKKNIYGHRVLIVVPDWVVCWVAVLCAYEVQIHYYINALMRLASRVIRTIIILNYEPKHSTRSNKHSPPTPNNCFIGIWMWANHAIRVKHSPTLFRCREICTKYLLSQQMCVLFVFIP